MVSILLNNDMIKNYNIYGDGNKDIYPAISTFAVQICYTNTFLLYSS